MNVDTSHRKKRMKNTQNINFLAEYFRKPFSYCFDWDHLDRGKGISTRKRHHVKQTHLQAIIYKFCCFFLFLFHEFYNNFGQITEEGNVQLKTKNLHWKNIKYLKKINAANAHCTSVNKYISLKLKIWMKTLARAHDFNISRQIDR